MGIIASTVGLTKGRQILDLLGYRNKSEIEGKNMALILRGTTPVFIAAGIVVAVYLAAFAVMAVAFGWV